MHQIKKYSTDILNQVKSSGTTIDRIWAWYIFGETAIELTPKELEVKQRLSETFSLLCNYHSPEQAKPIIREKYGISESQFYRDVRDAKRLYVDVTESSKAADRYIYSELAMKTFQLAAKEKDVKGMNMALANLIKIKELDKSDDTELTQEDLQSHNYYMVISLGNKPIKIDLNQIDGLHPTNRKKLAEMIGGEITDIEAEEIMDK
ncbi:MAG: hypothetical protein GYA62_00630 [Bacteroidales bacterium]|nr:hypothetical protein [Bacteroidales bacterium]